MIPPFGVVTRRLSTCSPLFQFFVLINRKNLKTFVPVLPMPENAGKTYGAIRALLESKGTPIGNNDLWIAAHAKATALTIVTNNEREFQRIPGLKVKNWVG